MTPRILFVDHVGVLGGAELSLLDLAHYFRSSSRVVLFEEGPFLERLRQDGIAAEVLIAPPAVRQVSRSGHLWQDVRAMGSVLHLARRLARMAETSDVLYANSQKSMVVAALAGKLIAKPVIWHLRDLMTRDHFSWSHRRLSALLANQWASLTITNSQATRDALVALGARSENVHTVYNGFDLHRFPLLDPDVIRAKRRDVHLNGAPVVGVFSRLAPWKGQHVLIQALAHLPGVQALFVGDALFDRDGSYVDHLRDMARALGVDSRVHFVGFRPDAFELMQTVDIVAHTSTAPEPFGRVVVEGMLAHKPVIATRAGGVLEIVDHESTGLLVPPNDPQALANTIMRLLSDSSFAARLAAAAHETARHRFSTEHSCQAIRDLVNQVTQTSSPMDSFRSLQA